MFIVYEDMSISLNRGDVGVIPVPQSKDGDYGYSISAGDVLRIRVFPKKKCEEVALVKDFLVETATSVIELELDGTDTKIGDIINKPTTYWYEIELNPDTHPQTIVGYNEDGPKVFMLYPEGDDSGELPSINTGKPVTVSDEAVKSIINNEIFQEAIKKVGFGNSSGVSDEKLAELIAEYIKNNPVETEQIQADFLQNDDSQPDFVKNKPTFDIDTSINPVKLVSKKIVSFGRQGSAVIFPFMGALNGQNYTITLDTFHANGATEHQEMTVSAVLNTNREIEIKTGDQVAGKDGFIIDASGNYVMNEDCFSMFHADRNIEYVTLTIKSGHLLKQVQRKYLPITNVVDGSDKLVTAEAVEKALSEKDIPEGSSVTITDISESTEDGGSNIVTFSDGSTVAIKNGSKGSKGEKGDKGADGKTPDKGTDYFTEADKQEMVEDVIASIDGIPNYWQDALTNGANAIRQAMESAGRNKSAFLFYSDAHWDYGSQMSPKLLKYLYKNTAINKTFFGGDIVNTQSKDVSDRDTMKYLYEWREMLRDLPNHHSVAGNHDDGNGKDEVTGVSYEHMFPKEYIYAYLLAPEENNDIVYGDGLYYYIDDNAEKTRYLFLDTACYGVDTTQESFISNALDTVQDGWHIVVVAHAWYEANYAWYEREDKTTDKNIWIAKDEDGNDALNANALKVANLLDAYNSKPDRNGKVEFCIGGHVHRDYFNKTKGGIPIILVETDSHHIRSEFSADAGTTSESSVNGIIADYDNQVITVVRVGRGSGRTVNLETGETHTHDYTYEITTAATCTTAGVRTYTCECGDTYTEIIPAIGHTYVDGVCSVCGAEDSDEPEQPTYTNVLDEVGYTKDVRLSASDGLTYERTNRYVTGYIPVNGSVTIYMENVVAPVSEADRPPLICHYDENQGFISGTGYGITDTTYTEDDGNITSFVSGGHTGVAYVRIQVNHIDENSIITVNEEI